jgi:hypothetical protein
MNPATTLRAEFEVAEQHRTWLWRCAYWTSQVVNIQNKDEEKSPPYSPNFR